GLRGHGVVGELLVELHLPGDALVLDADVAADAVFVGPGVDVVVRRIEPEVAIELPVVGVARVAARRRPDLLARLAVAAERRHAARQADRAVDAGPRPGRS